MVAAAAALIEDAAMAIAPDYADAIQGTISHDGKESARRGKEVLGSGEDIPAEGLGNFTKMSPPVFPRLSVRSVAAVGVLIRRNPTCRSAITAGSA